MKVVGIFPTKVKLDLSKDLGDEQPLGIAYVMAAAENAGHKVSLHYGYPDLERIVNYDVLALSLLTKDVPVGLNIAREYKARNPDGIVITGGPHISGDPTLVLDDTVDYMVIGEGEETFVELLNNLDNPEQVKGIVYARQGKVIQTEKRPRIKDLNRLRPLRDSTFNLYKDYSLAYPATSERILIPIISSRGCTMNCKFCTSPLIWNRQVIYRDPNDVLNELEELIQDKSKVLVFFDEENLFNKPEKAKELFMILSGKGYNLANCGDVRAIDEEMANLMVKAGYVQVLWGIESFNPAVLAREKKGLNTSKIRNVLNMIERKGIVNVGMTIIGFPEETEEDILQYTKELSNHAIHQLRVGIATPFPGTAFEKRLKQQGIAFDPDWSKWDTGHLVYEHPSISPERMQELQHQIVQDFYKSLQWDRRMHEMAKNFPKLKQSIDEFRSYISSHL